MGWAAARGHMWRTAAENRLWSGLTEGFRVGILAAWLPATASPAFRPWGGGLSHSLSGQRRPRGFRQACSMCIPVLRSAFSSAFCKRSHHTVSRATGIPQRGERGGALRKDLGKGPARIQEEGNTQEGGSAA